MKTVEEWDRGKIIPRQCKRLMRKQSRQELSYSDEWEGFRITNQKLELPTGRSVTPQETLIGIRLLEIGSELELQISSKIHQYTREIAKLK